MLTSPDFFSSKVMIVTPPVIAINKKVKSLVSQTHCSLFKMSKQNRKGAAVTLFGNHYENH